MKKIKNIFKNKVTRNASWMIIGRIYQMSLSFVVSMLTARYLGPSNYGLINYASSFTSFFSTFCVLGINSVIVKNFIDHPNEEGKTTGSAIGVRMISSICSVVLIMVATLFLDREERTTHLVVLLLGLGAIPQVFDTLNYWFQAKLESKYAAIASAIGYTVMMGYKISLLVFQKNVVWFAAASSIEYLVVAVCLYYNYRRHGGPSLSFSWRKVKELLNSSHHFILVSLMVSIYGSTDKLMLKQMLKIYDKYIKIGKIPVDEKVWKTFRLNRIPFLDKIKKMLRNTIMKK